MTLNGTHAVMEALQHSVKGTLYISADHTQYAQITSLASRQKCKYVVLNHQKIKSMGGRQGLLFKAQFSPSTYVADLPSWLQELNDARVLVLVLDHILDPQNLGAIVRSAVLLDVGLIIQPKRRSAPENEVAARSASGGMSIMPRYYTNNLAMAIEQLKAHDVWTYALDMAGKSLSEYTLPHRCAFVLGGEHKGVSNLVKHTCDDILSLPYNKKLDSFNVSVSASLACYEYYRQCVI